MALNQVIIMGRVTKELEIKQTPSGAAVLSFTVAVDRYSKNEEKAADFISCVAWNKTAEFIGKYFGKGRMIAVTGNLRTRNYEDKNGVKHYVTEVWVDNADFTGEPRNENNGSYSGGAERAADGTAGKSERISLAVYVRAAQGTARTAFGRHGGFRGVQR